MKARRRREDGNVSMFPFLAVLICTMGALILLLIIITHQAAAQAKREAEAEHSQRKTDLAEQREDAAWRREILQESLTKTREKLAELRQRLGYLEKDTTRLRDEVVELAKTLKHLEEQKPTSENAGELQQQLARLQAKIVTARRKLDEEMKKAIGKSQSYAVVPYHGPNETRRHPIYVECRSDGVVLQPEGIRLTEADFEGFFGPDNPLAAALRAKAGYLQQRYQFSKEIGTPYPLLLVRQSGIESSYAALQAMKSWDSEFGYELVEDDLPVNFNEPDLRLKQLVQQEIEHARTKKQALAKALPRLYHDPTLARSARSNGGRQYYAVSSGKGGIVPYSGDVEDYEPTRSRRPALARQGYPQGTGGPEDSGTNRGSGSYASAEGKNTPAELGGNGSAAPYNPGQYGTAQNNGTGQYITGQNGTGQNGSGQYGSGSYAANQGGSPGGTSMLGSSATPGASQANPNAAPNLVGASGTQGTLGHYDSSNSPRLLTPPGTGSGQQYSQGYNPSQYISEPGSENIVGLEGTGQNSSGNDPNGYDQTGSPQGSTQGYGQSQGASTVASGSTSMTANPNGGAGGASCPIGGAPCSSGAPSSPLAMGTPSAPEAPMPGQTAQTSLGIGEWQPNSGSGASAPSEPRAPDPFAPAHRQTRSRPESIAQERGKDWCLPKEAAYRVPLSRPVSIDCYPDRFVFRAKRGGIGETAIPLNGQTRDSINEFVSAVWDRVEAWGMAGQGMYWKPVVMVRVQPGGEARFADLQALFHESGFTVEKKR